MSGARTARARSGASSSTGAGFYRFPGLVARQPEDLLRRQFLDALLDRPEDAAFRKRSPRTTSSAAGRGTSIVLVARFQMDRLYSQFRDLHPESLCLFARPGQILPDHGRPERGERARLRRLRQISLFLLLDRRGPGQAVVRHVERRYAPDQLDLCRRLDQGRTESAGQGKR